VLIQESGPEPSRRRSVQDQCRIVAAGSLLAGCRPSGKVIQWSTSLQNLDLSGTEVTDAGLAYLRTLPGLRVLELNNTAVSDAGLEQLKGVTSLRFLSVKGTHVGAVGARSLRKALPDLSIER
jgi:hypothetical protein